MWRQVTAGLTWHGRGWGNRRVLQGKTDLRDAGVELGGDDDGALQVWVDLHDELACGGVGPVGSIFEAEDDVFGLLHLASDHGFHLREPSERCDGCVVGGAGAVGRRGSGGEEGGGRRAGRGPAWRRGRESCWT